MATGNPHVRGDAGGTSAVGACSVKLGGSARACVRDRAASSQFVVEHAIHALHHAPGSEGASQTSLTWHIFPYLESNRGHAAAKRTKAGWRGERMPPQQRGLGAGERQNQPPLPCPKCPTGFLMREVNSDHEDGSVATLCTSLHFG